MRAVRAKGISVGRDTAERRRTAVLEFLRKHGVTPKELGRRGGFNPNSIYNFLKGIFQFVERGHT